MEQEKNKRTKTVDEKFCSECGETINSKAEICPKCGVRQTISPKKLETDDTNKKNVLGIIIASIMGISVFLPWISSTSSGSVAGYSSSFSVGISGIFTGFGWFGLLLSIGGIIMALKSHKYSYIIGIVSIVTSLLLILSWTGLGFSTSGDGFSGSVKYVPQYGFFIFMLSSVLYLIFSLKKSTSLNILKFIKGFVLHLFLISLVLIGIPAVLNVFNVPTPFDLILLVLGIVGYLLFLFRKKLKRQK